MRTINRQSEIPSHQIGVTGFELFIRPEPALFSAICSPLIGVNTLLIVALAFGDDSFSLGANGRDIQISSRTLRHFVFAVAEDAVGGDVVGSHQIDDEAEQRVKLLGGGTGVVEVADEA